MEEPRCSTDSLVPAMHAGDEAENLIARSEPGGKEPWTYTESPNSTLNNTSLDDYKVHDSIERSNGRSLHPSSPLHVQCVHDYWINGWTGEIFSCAFALIVLLWLITTLRYVEGRIMTEVPLKISVNTLVAVFAVTIKASLLLAVSEGIGQLKWLWFARSRILSDFERFDLASRGPGGAFLLILHFRTHHLAALGAIITLLALAVDPFSQQLVRPVICHKVVPTTSARVPRTNNITDMSTYVGSVSATPEVGMIAAMYAGLLNVSQPVKFHCLTGNCTFPSKKSTAGSYQTLAVSSACVDISSEYSVTGNGTWHIEKMGNSSLLESWTTLDNYSSATVARTMIPDDGASAVTGYTEYARDTFKEHWPVGIPLTALSQVLFSAITVDLGCSDKNKSAPPCVMPLAVECRMWPVVQTIDARIELGGLVEPIVAETRLQHVFDYLPWHHVSSEVLRRGHLQPYIASPVATADNPLGMANYTSSGYPTQEDMRWYPQDCVWIVDYHTDRAIWSQLGKFFGRNRLVKVQLGEFRGQRIGKWMYDAPDSDVWMQLLFHNGTSTIDTTAAYMNQLASSMTTYVRMRLTDTAPLAHAYGDTIATKTCIQVRWAWISLPTALVISTALLLALPMSSADRHGSSMSGK